MFKNTVKLNYILIFLITFPVYGLEVHSVDNMLKEGSVSGQVRLGHINYASDVANTPDKSATAIGGQLKYETAMFNGISLGSALYISESISGLSGNSAQNKYASDLASDKRGYIELGEVYLNYSSDNLKIRLGRQLLDTPLADSDDIRMTPHTFEAYFASYTLKDLDLTFLGANILKWQGVDDDYNNVTNGKWSKTGENGTRMLGLLYENETLELSFWYYDVSKSVHATYTEMSRFVEFSNEVVVTLGVQYLKESEQDGSNVNGSIIGFMSALGVHDFNVLIAYNNVEVSSGKQIFEGFGGGSSYTNMDTNTAGFLHDGTTSGGSSKVLSIAYDLHGANIFAAYGTFKADAGVNLAKHVSELDLGIEYAYYNNQVEVALYYVKGEDKGSVSKTEYDDDHLQITLNYNF